MVTYCKTSAQAKAEAIEFTKGAVGVSFTHPDYGNQCTTLVQRFSRTLFGKSEYDTLGYGNAIDHPDNASRAYFDVIMNDPSKPNLLPKPGDVIVWKGAAPLWDGRYYGHVALVEDPGQVTVKVVQQDGAAAPTKAWPPEYKFKYSVKPAHRAEYAYIGGRGVGDVVGWLRPKPSKVIYTGADKRGYGVGTSAPSSTPKPKPVPAPVSTANQPKNWIDVSDYQPTSVIRNVPTDAAIIKITEGVGWASESTAGHVQAARAKGIPWMLYHFARPLVNSSDAEARWFLERARPYLKQSGFAGLVLDWEDDRAMGYAVWASDFLAYLRRHAPGVHLVLYTRRDFLLVKGWRAVDKSVPVWISAYGSDRRMNGYATSFAGAPSVPGWIMGAWQYSQRGRLKGYAGDLDLNRTLNGAMWRGASASSNSDDDWMEWIVSNEKEAREIIASEVRGTINHMLNYGTDDGKKIMARLEAAAGRGVLSAKIKGTENAPGDMAVGEHMKWERDRRGLSTNLVKDVKYIRDGVTAIAKNMYTLVTRQGAAESPVDAPTVSGSSAVPQAGNEAHSAGEEQIR